MPPIPVPIAFLSKTVYLFSNIYTPRNFICGQAICWLLSVSSVFSCGGEWSHFTGAGFQLELPLREVAHLFQGIVIRTCHLSPEHEAQWWAGGWHPPVCCISLKNLHISSAGSKVTSVWLSRCDSSVAWSSGVSIHQAASLHLCFPENWTELSLSVSFLKVRESPASAVGAFGGNMVGLSIVWFFAQVAKRTSTCELEVNVSFIY